MGFEPSVPFWLVDFKRSKMSMSGPVGVGGFEKGEFGGDSVTEKVAAQMHLGGADAIQFGAPEIDEATKTRIVVQRDPLGMDEVVRQRLRRAAGSVEIEPLGYKSTERRGRAVIPEPEGSDLGKNGKFVLGSASGVAGTPEGGSIRRSGLRATARSCSFSVALHPLFEPQPVRRA
jgi:hypothetical protein